MKPMLPFVQRLRRVGAALLSTGLAALLASVGVTGLNAEITEMPAKVKTEVEAAPMAPSPKAWILGLAPAKVAGLPAPDLTAALAEDAEAARNTDDKSPKRIGIKRPLESVDAEAASWNTLADGSRLWIGRFVSSGSFGTRLHFEGVKLPPGAVLIAYDRANPDRVEGPFDAAYLAGRDSFWSSTVFAEDVMVEAHVPAGAELPIFSVTELTHQYAGIGSDEAAKNAGSCEIDFACNTATWGTTGNAVGGLGSVSQNGVVFCTGCLLNDSNPAASTDYFLTANHCLTSQSAANSLEIYWLYQKPTCNGVEPNPATVPRTRGSADILSSRIRGAGAGQNDHSFLRLRGTVPAGVTYAGWTVNSPAAGEVITCIHHPDGDYKRISFGTVNTPLNSANYWNILWTPGRGVTEPGSSGSPIFNAAQQVIGQEFGGPSFCGNPNAATQNDDYGRFSITFPLIQTWLAPAVTATVIVYDAMFTTPVVDLDGDGFPSTFRLTWDPDVSPSTGGSLSVFERVYYKPAASGTWILFHTVPAHTITGDSVADTQFLDVSGKAHGTYDYRIEVIRAGQTAADQARDPSNDADLNDHPEELPSEDVGRPILAVRRIASNFGLSIRGTLGSHWLVQSSTVITGGWQTVGDVTLTADPTEWVDSRPAGDSERYYRLLLQ